MVLTPTSTGIDGGQIFKLFLPVTVTDPAGNAYAIGSAEYATLSTAIAAAGPAISYNFVATTTTARWPLR